IALMSGDLGQLNGLPVSVIIRTTLQDLESRAGIGISGGGTKIPIQDVIRMAAHASHHLAVFDQATGAALNYFRARRIASPAQRIMLIARDGGCTKPCCTTGAYGSQVHHATADWAEGGHTNVDEMTLACGPDNRMVGDGGYTTTINPDGNVEWHPPPGLDHGQHRINYHHRPELLLTPPENPQPQPGLTPEAEPNPAPDLTGYPEPTPNAAPDADPEPAPEPGPAPAREPDPDPEPAPGFTAENHPGHGPVPHRDPDPDWALAPDRVPEPHWDDWDQEWNPQCDTDFDTDVDQPTFTPLSAEYLWNPDSFQPDPTIPEPFGTELPPGWELLHASPPTGHLEATYAYDDPDPWPPIDHALTTNPARGP
uniref:DUF222 domain-containing protein n=1 Tax=Mycobacterium sp. URHD0025 TaxID=1298864 RepID=UPI0012DF70AF